INATPGSVLPRLLGARWRDDLFSDLPPPRSGRIKDGNGALAFGDPDANVDRVVAYITEGVFDAFDVEFAPTASGELSQLGVDMEREFGAPRDDGFFAPSQIGIEARVRLSTETATLRFEYEPLPEELRAPPPPPPAMTPLPPPSDEVEIFEIVDQSPELIGGLPELQRRVEYPEEARLQEIEGRVFVQFIVNEIGVVEDAVCARSPNALLCDAALAAVRGSKFRPGMQRGRPVKVRFVLPVDFKLR
ncbi:MAG: energy transducer TonB, partial [Bacteroidota bacterium]